MSELTLTLVGAVRRTGDRTFEVDSRTRGGLVHKIDWALDGALYCRCEAAAFERKCWAVKKVRKVVDAMTTETGMAVVPVQMQRPVSLIPSDSELNRMGKVAAIFLAGGVDLPKELNTPEKVMAVMLKGRALGLDPSIAIEHIHYIDGHSVPDAQIMAGILARDVPNSKLMLTETPDGQSCTMRLILPSRGVDASYTVSMTDQDVRMLIERDTPHQAKSRDGGTYMTKPGGWVMYPRDRLRWHATKRILKTYAPDVINGLAMYGVGEYAELGDAELTVIEGQTIIRETGEIIDVTPNVHGFEQPAAGPKVGAPTPAPEASRPSQPGPAATPPEPEDDHPFAPENTPTPLIVPKTMSGYREYVLGAIRSAGLEDDVIESVGRELFPSLQNIDKLSPAQLQELAEFNGVTVALPGQPVLV